MEFLRLAQIFSRYYYPAFSQRHCVLFTLKIQESPLLFRFQSCFVAIRRLLGRCLAKQVVVVCFYYTYTSHIFCPTQNFQAESSSRSLFSSTHCNPFPCMYTPKWASFFPGSHCVTFSGGLQVLKRDGGNGKSSLNRPKFQKSLVGRYRQMESRKYCQENVLHCVHSQSTTLWDSADRMQMSFVCPIYFDDRCFVVLSK